MNDTAAPQPHQDVTNTSATVETLLERLGPALLDPSHLATPSPAVRDALIYDPADPPPLRRGDLVLGVGLTAASLNGSAAALLPALASAGCAALVVKGDIHDDVTDLFARAGTTLLRCTSGTSWARLLQLARTAVTTDGHHDGASLAGVPFGDLFALANAVSAVLDAPVTIEDRQSWVLAYSGRQHEADQARAETILGRRIPDRYMSCLERAGIFNHLLTSDEPLYWDGSSEGVKPRLVVAVRAGGELLGSLWAVLAEPPSAQDTAAFGQIASLVALHMLRHRASLDTTEAVQATLATRVLLGSNGNVEAATRLGLTGLAVHVLALQLHDVEPTDQQAWLQRLRDMLALHLGALDRRSCCVDFGGVLYALVPAHGRDHTTSAPKRMARDFLSRTRMRERVSIAVSGRASGLSAIPAARTEADEVLRVLAATHPLDVADLDDVRLPVLLLRMKEAVEDPRLLIGPQLRDLVTYDHEHGTAYLQTLSAYLDAFGDVTAAADRIHVHKNSLRYRIRRMRELFGLDLDDSDARLSVTLQLRFLDAPTAQRATPPPSATPRVSA